jgi:hypothetical protein
MNIMETMMAVAALALAIGSGYAADDVVDFCGLSG